MANGCSPHDPYEMILPESSQPVVHPLVRLGPGYLTSLAFGALGALCRWRWLPPCCAACDLDLPDSGKLSGRGDPAAPDDAGAGAGLGIEEELAVEQLEPLAQAEEADTVLVTTEHMARRGKTNPVVFDRQT